MRPYIPRFAPLMLCLALAACGGDAPKPAPRIEAPQEAVSRVGDVTVRANVLLTEGLAEAMAQQYGIERDPGTVMLLVSVRQGPEGRDTALPATVDATVANLQGQRQTLAMREIRSGEYVDYVGTAKVSPPDTLRFDLKIVREGDAASTMTFSRDFAR
ncbi:MAG: DUF4426 domain-containing protein [Pseudomonadota bacterium]|jgi:hypothetical protein